MCRLMRAPVQLGDRRWLLGGDKPMKNRLGTRSAGPGRRSGQSPRYRQAPRCPSTRPRSSRRSRACASGRNSPRRPRRGRGLRRPVVGKPGLGPAAARGWRQTRPARSTNSAWRRQSTVPSEASQSGTCERCTFRLTLQELGRMPGTETPGATRGFGVLHRTVVLATAASVPCPAGRAGSSTTRRSSGKPASPPSANGGWRAARSGLAAAGRPIGAQADLAWGGAGHAAPPRTTLPHSVARIRDRRRDRMRTGPDAFPCALRRAHRQKDGRSRRVGSADTAPRAGWADRSSRARTAGRNALPSPVRPGRGAPASNRSAYRRDRFGRQAATRTLKRCCAERCGTPTGSPRPTTHSPTRQPHPSPRRLGYALTCPRENREPAKSGQAKQAGHDAPRSSCRYKSYAARAVAARSRPACIGNLDIRRFSDRVDPSGPSSSLSGAGRGAERPRRVHGTGPARCRAEIQHPDGARRRRAKRLTLAAAGKAIPFRRR